jgi:hypothetical protein
MMACTTAIVLLLAPAADDTLGVSIAPHLLMLVSQSAWLSEPHDPGQTLQGKEAKRIPWVTPCSVCLNRYGLGELCQLPQGW